jgi:hypothetical protein
VAVWKHWHVYPFFLSCRKMLRWSTQVRPPAFSLGSDNTAKLKKKLNCLLPWAFSLSSYT